MLTNLRTWFCRSVMTLLLMLPVTLGWAGNDELQWGIKGNDSPIKTVPISYNNGTGTATMDLEADKTYWFRFTNNGGKWYSKLGEMTSDNCTGWEFGQNDEQKCHITTTAAGNYTFTVTWSGSTPIVSITYPTGVPANLPSSLTFRSDYTGWDTQTSMIRDDNGKKWSYTIDFTSSGVPSSVYFRFIDTADADHSIISKANGDEVTVNGSAIEGEMKKSDDPHNFMFIPSGYYKYTITAEYIDGKWMVSVKAVEESKIEPFYLIVPNANVGNTRRAVPASEGIAPEGHTAFRLMPGRERNSTALNYDLTSINLKIDGDKGQQLRYDSKGQIKFYIQKGNKKSFFQPTNNEDDIYVKKTAKDTDNSSSGYYGVTATNGVDGYGVLSNSMSTQNNGHYFIITKKDADEKLSTDDNNPNNYRTRSLTFMFSENNGKHKFIRKKGDSDTKPNGNSVNGFANNGNLIVGFQHTRGYGSAYYNDHINKKGSGVYLVGQMKDGYTSNKNYEMEKKVYPSGASDAEADSIVYVREVDKGDNSWDNFFLSFSTGDVVESNKHWNLLLRPHVQDQMDGQALEGGVFFFKNNEGDDNQQQALNPLLSDEQKKRYVSYKVYFNATYSTYRIEFYNNFYIAGPAVHGQPGQDVNSGEYFKPENRIAMKEENVHGVTHYVYTGKFTQGSTFAFFVNDKAYTCNYSEDEDYTNVNKNTDGMWTTQAPEGGREDGKDKDYPFYNHVRWNTDGDNSLGSLGPNNNGIKWTLPTGTYTLRFYNHAEKSNNNQLYTIDKVVTLKNATSEFVEKDGASVKHNYGGWRTFSDDCALWLPNGIKAYYASEITGSKVKLTEVEGGMIPAHTGVLIYDGNLLADSESEDIHLYPVPTGYTTRLGSDKTNLFVDCYRENRTISHTETVNNNNYYNYFFTCFYKKLGDFSKSDVPMSFWKTRDQNALAKKNYTYLRVSTEIKPVAFNSNTMNYEQEPDATNVANNARDYCFLFSLDDLDDPLITGITAPAVENSMETKAEGWYTMQGVKIQKPVKAGMYIHNGRKVIVR